MKKKLVLLCLIVAVATISMACSQVTAKALHISYHENQIYGTGDYVFSTVTFTGQGLGEEKVFSVKDLEGKAKNSSLGYQGPYSSMTRGGIFSIHQMSGIKLYDFLLSIGMDEAIDESTKIKVISRDGYMTVLTVGQIKNSKYNTYNNKDSDKAKSENVPTILAFGSDKVPLVGPVGVNKPGYQTTEEEGFVKTAENLGGPVRLIGGQEKPDHYNAPDNAKWVKTVVVGEPLDETWGLTWEETTRWATPSLTVSVNDSQGFIKTKAYSCQDLVEAMKVQTVEGYYGTGDFYKGVNFWGFLASDLQFASREGSVTLTFTDGTSQVLDIEYFRNITGDYRKYTAEKEGLTLTGQKPGLAVKINGKATDGQIYAILPKVDGVLEKSQAKSLVDIQINLVGQGSLTENPYGDRQITITGEGVKEDKTVSVNQLERYYDLTVSDGSYSGISLMGFLDEIGLAIDAKEITIIGDTKATYTMEQLESGRGTIILATRLEGKPLEKEGPVKVDTVTNVTQIYVSAKEGNWTHSEEPYNQYLDSTLKITGPEAKATKKYTLKQLEEKTYIKDSFGSSAGIGGYQGVSLKDLISENLKSGLERPTKITVIGKDGYETTLSVDDVWDGVNSCYQIGQRRQVILAYSLNGSPLVENQEAKGFNGENGFGPIRLVVENQVSKWVKSVVEIRLGQ